MGLSVLPTPEQALPGRNLPLSLPEFHYVNGHPLAPPYPEGCQQALFGMGCFWGAERKFWEQRGVFVTLAGYAAGYTPNPGYDEVCSGLTAHAEVVKVVFDPSGIGFDVLLELFWNGHDPTQGMRQGVDRGTQYRSLLGVYSEQHYQQVEASRTACQRILTAQGRDAITTEIVRDAVFYPAEDYHQQYLAKNPRRTCW